MTKSSKKKLQVFISYSHKDQLYLEDLKRHFKSLINVVDFWDDSKIFIGQNWKNQIQNALTNSEVAILLISADFFNSDFIESNELPPLLKKAEQNGTTIISIIVRPCLFEAYPELNKYQALNSPNTPISSMDETSREMMWVKLAKQIQRLVNEDKQS